MTSQSPLVLVTPEFPPEARLCVTCPHRHMNTLQLQMEVTRFLHRCESAGTSQVTTSPLPTLFGNNHMKMDVACKVCLMSQAPDRLLNAHHAWNRLIFSVVCLMAASPMECEPQKAVA